MGKQQTITINGVVYDAHTGMRMAEETRNVQSEKRAARPNHASASKMVHTKQQHSSTLNRAFVTQPKKSAVHQDIIARPKQSRSPQIQRFAPNQHLAQQPNRPVMSDIGPVAHPATKKAAEKRHSQIQAAKRTQSVVANPATLQQNTHIAKPQPKPAQEIKQRAIENAMKNARPHKQKKQSFFKRHPRALSISSASLALVLLAGYFSYINLPNLSVRLAATQAGIDASYPSYRPAGYSLSGPVAYAGGQVSMKFASNAGPQNFTLRQTKSNWDSSAVLTNYVEPKSNGDYSTLTQDGLTVYVYGDGGAAWVNGGILYTIENSGLSNQQILSTATSL